MPRRDTPQSFDKIALLLILVLTGVGIVMLYSSSADTAFDLTGDNMFFLKRQIVRIALGAGLMFICARMDYHRLQGVASALLVGAVLLLITTLLYHKISGASGVARWLPLGPISIQPSDLARLSLIIYLASYLDRKGTQITNFSRGFLPPLFMITIIMALIVLAPDFSTAVLTGFLAIVILYLGGAKFKHIASVGLTAIPLMAAVLIAEPYRRVRIKSFIGLSDSPDQTYQISQSLISLGNGGWFGSGLGNSIEKKLFLPAPHTDFVYAIIGEELGFIGAIILLGAFFWLFQRGLVIARNAPDRFGMFLSLGIVLNILMYVVVNTGVATEVLPNTGVPLPLISYGGTHIVFTLMSLGILLNISTATRRRKWGQQLVHAKARS